MTSDYPSGLAIIGTQWGDEGKGKLVDILAPQYDYICRSSGGANAGHTIVVDGKKYIFHLLPSCLLHPSCQAVVGNGTVVDPVGLHQEVANLEKQGVKVQDRVFVSGQAHLLFDYHKQIDQWQEQQKGNDKIGTTGRGIGPAYIDKTARIGIRCEDVANLDELFAKIKNNVEWHARQYPDLALDAQAECDRLAPVAEWFASRLVDARALLYQAQQENKKILFEGAQAYHLDLDQGTYPFVTSSAVSAGGIMTGLGVSPKSLKRVLGVAKAYTTRVGAGGFPSELTDETGDMLRENGGEFGSTTGRPRRCGWFDAMVVRQAVRYNGIDELCLTKLDVLTGLPELKVAVGYKLYGQSVDAIPTIASDLEALEIDWQTFEGWNETLSDCRTFEDLPAAAQAYIVAIEKLTEAPITSIGVGCDRSDIIFRKK